MEARVDRFAAVILAGDRLDDESVAKAAEAPSKCLVPIHGKPMVLRVIEALETAADVDRLALCGPAWSIVSRAPALRRRIESREIAWVEPAASPSASAASAIGTLPQEHPVLLTTADHALLNAAMVDHFLAEARKTACDAVVALTLYETVAAAYPGSRRTVIRLRDGNFCGCNLFAFLTPRGRQGAIFWRRLEARRKQPLRLVSALGWSTTLRYLLGRLALDDALDRVSRLAGLRLGAIIMPFAEAAVDVDSVADLALVERILDGSSNTRHRR